MPAVINKMNIARALTIFGFLYGWGSVGATWAHIGDPAFVLTDDARLAVTHAWHHYFREVFGDFATMIAVLLMLYVPAQLRQPIVWWAMLVLLAGFYAPFWVGVPFMPELGAPSMSAEIQHIVMAVPPVVGLFICRSEYFPVKGAVKGAEPA
ncbi:MAG TPA: hypothetical protein VIV14_09600 [Gammaproteobacteria bacterium]